MLKKHTQIEQAIADYDYLNKQIKALEKQKEAIKDTLIKSYFGDQPEYIDINGCVLATYREYSREGLDGKRIKIELPEVYSDYLLVTKYNRLEIK